MNTYIEFCVLLGLWTLFAKYGASALVVPAILLVPILLTLRWDDEMADRFPRWLGGMDSSAPPSILDTDVQSIVREEKQKVTKTDEGEPNAG